MLSLDGTYSATLDEKDRVVLPAALKKELGELAFKPLTIQKHLSKNCLDIFPEDSWNERLQKFTAEIDELDDNDDSFLQYFKETFMKVEMAPNGRISIPSEFIDYSGIKKNIRIIGMTKFIRLWDVDEYLKGTMDKETFNRKFNEKRKKQ